MGSVAFAIDPAQVTTNGGVGTSPLLTLALSVPQGTHDLPVLSVPQPSDPPASGMPTVLDLTGYDGQLLDHDSVLPNQVSTTLYPVDVPGDALNAAPQATPTLPPTATPPQQTVTGGTAVPPTATPPVPTVAQSTPTTLGQQVSLGAPAIDSNGRLVGMVIPDAAGNHVLASTAVLVQAMGAVSSKSGPLMTQWQQGLAAYYAAPPQFAQAAASFDSLATAYPDFGGVQPFRTAAHQQSTTIASLTASTAPVSVSPTTTSTRPSRGTLLLLAALVAAALLLLALLLVLVLRRHRRKTAPSAPAVPPEEAMLDLLPPNAPLEALPLAPEMPPLPGADATLPLPAMPPLDADGQATLRLPRVQPDPARLRRGLALMPHAAGRTDPGIKRASDPNQDNILAVVGLRIVGGRVQPYGLFIVADGMGGHLNGQEASRLAIEIAARGVLQVLATSQPLTDEQIRTLLRDGPLNAGAELRQRNLASRLDMGTTMTAALVVDDVAYVVNVGDSRTYLMSPEHGLRQITTDHSVVASLVAAGVIRPEDVYTHPRRNQIYRSLGGEHDDIEVDLYEVPLQAGDKLLLCSDGLWEMVRDPQIANILRGAADPQQAVDLLIREANANGGDDNIGVVVVRMLEDVPQQAEPTMQVLAAPHSVESPERRS
jgi:serine/threonine protein phosphatase PrpC